MVLTVFVATVPGLEPLKLVKANDTKICDLVSEINHKLPCSVVKSSYLSLKSGKLLPASESETLDEIVVQDSSFIELRLNVCICGGKGGFGSMLKAQGTKMSRKKNKNTKEYTDSLRTVDGVRMKVLRQAKELHDHLEASPLREKEAMEKKRAKLESIINSTSQSGKITKFRDEEFLEHSEQLLDDIRGAVALSVSKEDKPLDEVSRVESSGSGSNSNFSSRSSVSSNSSSSGAKCDIVSSKLKGMGFFGSDDYENSDSD